MVRHALAALVLAAVPLLRPAAAPQAGPAAAPAPAPAAPDASAAQPAAPRRPSIAEQVAARTAAEVDAAIARLELPDIGPEQRKLLAQYAAGDYCYCGCPHSVSGCLLNHKPCKHSARQLRLAAGLVALRPTASVDEIKKYVAQYYMSFDHRQKLEVAGFGPPLGEEKAPVTLVEYSDFTCPFCQTFRPVLEAFVAAHPGQVKLLFKPFPLESHMGSVDVAMAGEWAREKGAFWRFHDALFDARSHELDDLADLAQRLGLDADDLRDAISTHRFEQKVLASRASGMAAGVSQTPSVFLNGRLLNLPDNTAAWLQFTLEDELEWLKHPGKWDRD